MDRQERNFLVIVDATEELERALYYACRRAKRVDGRVVLLACTMAPGAGDFMQLLGIGDRLEKEGREEAEQLCFDLAEKVYQWSGKYATVVICEELQQSVAGLLEQEGVAIIIMPMPRSGSPSGDWASYMLKEGAESMRIPITMVPTNMSIDKINKLT